MRCVLHVVLVFAHDGLALLAHVTTEVLVMQFAEPHQALERDAPVPGDMDELRIVCLQHLS